MNTQQTNGSHSAAAILQPAWPASLTKDQTLQVWLDSKRALEDAKAAEMMARSAVVDAFPFDADSIEGTQRLPLANGYELKVVKKLNYTLDKEQTEAALDKLAKLGSDGEFVADRLVSWSPSLSVAEYRLLSAAHRGVIDEVLTVKPGAPTLELIEPKVKK